MMVMPSTTSAWTFALAGVAAIFFGLACLFWPGLTVFVLVTLFGIFTLIEGIAALIRTVRQMGARETWWPSLLVGLLNVIVGFYVLFNPVSAALILLWVIAFWAVALGILEILGSLRTGQFLDLIVGAVTVLFGFILLSHPVSGGLALIQVIGVFAIVRGILLLVEATHAPAMPRTPAA